jgi:DNA polymerase-1
MSALPPPATPGTLYLIDLSGYVFRAYHALPPLSSSRGEPSHAVLGTVNMLQKVVNERRPDMLAVAMDSPTSFRRAVDERYKATRRAAPPDLRQQMARAEEIVRAYNIPVYQEDGLEADDLIAAVVRRAMRDDDVRVVIVSADKDLMQLVRDDDERVVLWDSMRDKVYGPAEVREKHGVAPSKMRDLLALMGDSSDNVPGVPGVGPKTAADLLNEHGTLDGIYRDLSAIKRPKIREALAQHERDARISQELVTLREEADVAWDRAHLKYGGADQEKLRALFTELEFSRLLDQLEPQAPTTRSCTLVLDAGALENVAAKARETKRLALDLEVTSREAMRCAIVGVGLAAEPGEGYYVPLSHRYLGAPKQLDWGTFARVIGPVLADASVKKVGHELKFDEVALSRRGLEIAGPVADTMLCAYLLDPEASSDLADLAKRELDVTLMAQADLVGRASRSPKGEKQRGARQGIDEVEVERATPYVAARAEVCLELERRIAPRIEREGLGKLMNEVELPLSRVLARMERHGVLVDVAKLEHASRVVEGTLKGLEARAKELAGGDFTVRSRDQLETILFDRLKLPVVKRTPKGGRSTDADVLEELAGKHPLPRVVLEFRELDKLKGTYLDALPRYVNPETGRIHTRFDQAVAATGRLSSSDPNLQNIPIRTEIGREIRAAFVAPPGSCVVSADYSQIELRVLAHLSQDAQLIEAFRTDQDIHTYTASLVFDVKKEDVTREMRARAKTINFGVIYGMGDASLAKQLGISRDEAARFIEAYFTRYEGVRRFMENTIEAAKKGEAVRTMMGRRRFLPNLHSPNRGLRFEAERIAKNTPIQGTAADILKLAMVRLGEQPVVPGGAMVLTVHDELVFEVPAAEVEAAKRKIKETMENVVKLDVPLLVDAGAGASWKDAH